MGLLHLSAGVPLLDMEVETDEGKRQADRLGLCGGPLGAKGIDDELMDEARLGMSEGLARGVVADVQFWLFDH